MDTALYINGIYGGVLQEILDSQDKYEGEYFLQPYKQVQIAVLRNRQPSPNSPMRLYASTTNDLSQISHTALIVGWEDKREISAQRFEEVRQHLERFQPGELKLFIGESFKGDAPTNLITVRDIRKLSSSYSTSLLRKVRDDLPLKRRTRSGGWSEVYEVPALLERSCKTQEDYRQQINQGIEAAVDCSSEELEERLALAPKIPSRTQVITIAFERNPYVIVAVLRRANGKCEECGHSAPFLRRSDGSPYLEVHHKVPLSEGGEDTTENAVALCPNCHRKVHYGLEAE